MLLISLLKLEEFECEEESFNIESYFLIHLLLSIFVFYLSSTKLL